MIFLHKPYAIKFHHVIRLPDRPKNPIRHQKLAHRCNTVMQGVHTNVERVTGRRESVCQILPSNGVETHNAGYFKSFSYVSDVSLNATPPAALYKHSRKSNPSWIGKEPRLAKEKCTFHAECSSYGWEARLTQGAKSQRATCCQSLENRTIERPVVLIDMRKGSTYGAERSKLRALEYGHWWCHDFSLYTWQASGCIDYV